MDFAAALEQALVDCIGPQRFKLWFQNRTRFVLDGEALVVRVPNLHLQEWLKKEYREALRAAALAVLGRAAEVRFQIDAELFRANREVRTEAAGQAKPQPKPLLQPDRTLFDGIDEKMQRRKAQVSKRRWRHLGDFIVGQCNRVACAAAQSAVEEPGQGPNPLILHGPVGTGKTHLLEGIFAGIRRRFPELRVVFVTSEDFTNRFVSSVRFGKQAAFRKYFRTCDVLLLDDVHFLARKRATQEEFLHTLDALLDEGRQVALTCDCHPRLNEEFMPELLDRLLGGAIWGLQPPDAETRLAFLRSRTVHASRRRKPPEDAASQPEEDAPRTAIPDDVLIFLANQLRGNIRELEGAWHSIHHFSRVTNRQIDLALAREALGDLLRHAVRVVRLADVDAAVCGVMQLPGGALQGKERAWAVSHSRMLAIFLCRKHTAASFGEISKHFGGKSHSTAVAAEKKIRAWLAASDTLAAGGREWPIRELVERVERELLD